MRFLSRAAYVTLFYLTSGAVAFAADGGFGAYFDGKESPRAEAGPAPVTKKKKKKRPRAEPIAAAETPERAPAAITVPELPGPPPAAGVSPFKFGAFADFRFTRLNVRGDAGAFPNAESGFGLEDGAFYGNYDDGKLSVVLDLAVRRGKDVDLNPAATLKNQSSNANFGIGLDKSQLYLKYRLSDAVLVDLGQFDTIFGVELNDSKDRYFGKTGLVFDSSIPNTHTGLMVETLWHGFYAKGLAANPAGKGSFGTSTAGDDKVEAGGAVGYGDETFHAQVGVMARSILRPDGARSSRSLLDATAGTVLGRFTFDVEVSRLDDGSKNTLNPANLSDKEAAGMGYFTLATYKITEPWSVGVRWEELRNDPGSTGVASSSGKAVGTHYRLTPALELRTEFIDYRFRNANGTPSGASRFNFAAVVSF